MFKLDEFQQKAIDEFASGKNLIVTANTGSGKTLVATEVIATTTGRVWYTTPIKALSNEKYLDFSKLFGPENVGLLTGDIKVNPDARIVVATTEILNNSLMSKKVNLATLVDPMAHREFESPELVVFDEAHYINDNSRGYVWEETLIGLSRLDGPRVVLLSATISNAKQLKKWLDGLFQLEFSIVTNSKRVVPLKFRLVNESLELCEPHDKSCQPLKQPTKHKIESLLGKSLDRLPMIVWLLSKKNVETHAVGCDLSFTNPEERRRVQHELELFEQQLRASATEIPALYHKLRLENGVACHHAGMSCLLRELVERLFKMKLIKVVFATETFSVGINFPAKSVLFTGLKKPGTRGMRMFEPSEFIQMAGRAGRRGLDTIGYVDIIARDVPLDDVRKLIKSKPGPLKSKYILSYSSMLQGSLFDFTKKSFSVEPIAGYDNVAHVLEEFDLVNDGKLTRKGRAAACFADINPILGVEILLTLQDQPGRVVIRALASVGSTFDSEASEELEWLIDLENTLKRIETQHAANQESTLVNFGALDALDMWAKSKPIREITEATSIDEGSLIKELQRVKAVCVSALRALYVLELPETAHRVFESATKLMRRELLPDSYMMRG